MTFGTFVILENGKVLHLGRGEYPPRHNHLNRGFCPECKVKEAGTAPVALTDAEIKAYIFSPVS